MSHVFDPSETKDLRKQKLANFKHMLSHVPPRLMILFAGTITISDLYKCMIDVGVFQQIPTVIMHRLVYCSFELLLLGIFWYYLFVFSRKCRHSSRTLADYYQTTVIVAALYALICCVSFVFLSEEQYSWLLRLTLNLCGLRFRTTYPDNLSLYLLAFLGISILIMLLEPTIAQKRHERQKRMMEGKPSFLQTKINEYVNLFYKKKYDRALRKYRKALHEKEHRDKHRH